MFACIHIAGSQERCLERLVMLARGFTPLIEETCDDGILLDLAGCERLFGSPRSIAKEIGRRSCDAGLTANVAIASNPDAASCAARGLAGTTVIAPQTEMATLAALPLEVLREIATRSALLHSKTHARKPTDETFQVDGNSSLAARNETAEETARRIDEAIETLQLWGIHKFGELARLPEAELSERLGTVGVRLRKLARGEGDRPLWLKRSEPVYQKTLDLDDPIELLEPLSFVLSGLLQALCAELKSHGLATNELRLRMKLEDRSTYERSIGLPFPINSQRVFLRLFALDIESHPPHAAIVSVSVAAEPALPRALQNGLFQPLAPEPEKLELTLVRLMKLVGANNVGSPEILDTHRPDAFRMRRFNLKERAPQARPTRSRARQSGFQANKPALKKSKCRLGFRVFRPPLRAEVDYESGRPTRIRARCEQQSRVISGPVKHVAGPWRTSGEWWRSDGWSRDEWDVSVGDPGAYYRIYLDRASGVWFVEGMYD
jgi:protein ImuB